MTRRLTRRRLVVALAQTTALLALAFALALFLGRTGDGSIFTLLDPVRAIGGDPSEPGSPAQIFLHYRLPRALAAALSGAGLAAAGVAFQAVLRNPLAEPYTLGVSPGAGLGAVLAISLGLEPALGPSAIAICAFLGSLAVVGLVWRVARVGASRPPATLILAGITLAFLCSAGTMFLQHLSSYADSARMVHWLMGGLEVVDPGDLARAAIVVAIGVGVLVVLARDLNALAAGEDAAASVGVPVTRAVRLTFVGASAVVAAIVAVAGPIGFVGIVVPHALRALVGPDHRVLLPVSVLGGAAFVLLTDTVARLLLWPHQIPVGVVTALVGGTFFLGLLLVEKGRARLWGG
jgi:iron complex transport system permease protein